MVTLADLQVRQLASAGTPPRSESTLRRGRRTSTTWTRTTGCCSTTPSGWSRPTASRSPNCSTLEPGGPRQKAFFPPGATTAGIVTCGGLCLGLNDVIRGLVMELNTHYEVSEVVGFRNGYAGLVPASGPSRSRSPQNGSPRLTCRAGPSWALPRGAQDPDVMVDRLVELGIDILFVIGGDGSMRGGSRIAAVDRGSAISVIGIPKTIDNDIPFIGQSFGFQTAFTVAAQSIAAAQVEAQSAINGIGLVQLMGCHAGFIARYAALGQPSRRLRVDSGGAVRPARRIRVPGRPGTAGGRTRQRCRGGRRGGRGQDLMADLRATDASGNKRLGDIGRFLEAEIAGHYRSLGRN